MFYASFRTNKRSDPADTERIASFSNYHMFGDFVFQSNFIAPAR